MSGKLENINRGKKRAYKTGTSNVLAANAARAAKKVQLLLPNDLSPCCPTCRLSPKPDPLNICACCGSKTFINTTEIHLDASHEPTNEVLFGRDSLRDSTYQHVICI